MAAELRAAFDRVVDSGAFSSGLEVTKFESDLAVRFGFSHVVGVGSGTAALHLALAAGGVEPGDEVIIPANTFVATAEAVCAAGAQPVFVDVEPDSGLIDVGAVEAAITARTSAIVAVHLYGQPADMSSLSAISARAGLLLVEDAAQALGATSGTRPAGALGDVAAFSFYPTKTLGALGEAGAVVTADGDLADRVRQLRNHGDAARHGHVRVGTNARMDELQAALLSAKLPWTAELHCERRALAADYMARLTDIPSAVPVRTRHGVDHAHHLFVVQVPERDLVIKKLHARGTDARVHYPTPLHLQPAYLCESGVESLPVAERWAGTVLSLPFFPGMTTGQVDAVITALAVALEATATVD